MASHQQLSQVGAHSVYAKGYSVYGQILGHKEGRTSSSLFKMEKLSKYKLINICCGEQISVGLTEDGQVIRWGGQSDIERIDVPEPIVEIKGNNNTFVMVSANRNGFQYNTNSKALTKMERKVVDFAMQTFEFYYLDDNYNVYQDTNSVQLDFGGRQDKVVKMYGTNQAGRVFFVTSLNRVYTNDATIRGTAVDQTVQGDRFFEVQYFNDHPVRQFFMALDFTVAHLMNNDWVIFGAIASNMIPAVKIELPPHDNDIVNCHLTWYSGLLVTRKGGIYGIGSNEMEELTPNVEWREPRLTDTYAAVDVTKYNKVPVSGSEKVKIIGNGGVLFFLVDYHRQLWNIKLHNSWKQKTSFHTDVVIQFSKK